MFIWGVHHANGNMLGYKPRPPFNCRSYKNFVKNNSGYRGGSTNKRRDKRRFLLYGLYAWGVPLILTGLTAAMQFSDLPNHIIRPGFGTKRCWFVGKWNYLYLRGYIAVQGLMLLYVIKSWLWNKQRTRSYLVYVRERRLHSCLRLWHNKGYLPSMHELSTSFCHHNYDLTQVSKIIFLLS